jgi:hypothetical protein
LSAGDAAGELEPVVVVVSDPTVVEGVDEQPANGTAAQVMTTAILANRVPTGFLGVILIVKA